MSDMKDIYENSTDNLYRFALGKMGSNPLICFGINPSIATPKHYDRTMQKLETLSERFGFDGYVMFNLYPERSKDPKKLPKKPNQEACIENIKRIEKVLSQLPSTTDTVLAAWGDSINNHDYLKTCLKDIAKMMEQHGYRWVCIGKSKSGNPYHPLVRFTKEQWETTKLTDFDINQYLARS